MARSAVRAPLARSTAVLESRRTYATPSASTASSSSAPASSSARPSRRSARYTARPGADMVGLPDPISNLRPIRYGSAFEEASSSSSSSSASTSPHASSSAAALSMSHPYSLHEFTTSGESGFGWSGNARRGSKSPSLYFERLLSKLEEAELAHKLRMARADNFNQRFWQDNNARFIQALSEFRSRTGSSKAVATLPASASTSSADGKQAATMQGSQESELDLDSDSLATFYSAWLKANAARHRAYNRQLWRQTFGDLAPAARYQCLRAWAKVVGSVERRLGRVN
ncbi:uncharacterized protein UTRI_03666 [Ustilago trichophora]|uniref:Uncharacterized protein n=1 Tax=Ustilago trichophora TaxID=86804 RepID=A0A5C3E1R8_9BASI|nr:uncharacterized protein UTRI_03666 [Ustilago trichophora]